MPARDLKRFERFGHCPPRDAEKAGILLGKTSTIVLASYCFDKSNIQSSIAFSNGMAQPLRPKSGPLARTVNLVRELPGRKFSKSYANFQSFRV